LESETAAAILKPPAQRCGAKSISQASLTKRNGAQRGQNSLPLMHNSSYA